MAAPGDKPAGKHQGQRMSPADHLQKELDQLNLTDDQKKQVDPIMTKLKDDLNTIMSDKTATKEDKRSKAGDLLKAANKDIEAILTPEQKAQLEKDRAAHRGKDGKGKKAGGDKPAN